MNITRQEAEHLDTVVSYLITSKNYIDGRDIKNVLTDIEEDYGFALVDMLINYGEDVVFLSNGNTYNKFIRAGSSAKYFLDKGGFTAKFDEAHKSLEEQKNLKNKETLKLQLEIDDLTNKLVDYDTTKWQAKWAFIITIISVLLAALALIL